MAKRNNRRPARSPYNFVPLNGEIVESTATNAKPAEKPLKSGYIDFKIEAKTDIFIRGLKEMFFSPNGKLCIPGSSLRGMLRTLTEICSYSKMEFVNRNRRIFFRNFGDRQYRNRLDKMKQNIQAGWLFKYKDKYYFDNNKGNGYKIYRIHRASIKNEHHVNSIYSFTKIYYQEPYNSIEIKSYSISKDNSANSTGFLLITGNIPNKMYERIIESHTINANNLNAQTIKTEYYQDVTSIIELYKSDETRNPEVDLVEHLKSTNPVPCFVHVDSNNRPTCIGHMPNFRIPSDYKIVNAISQKNEGIVDFAKSMFGIVYDQDNPPPAKAGKLFVEDSWAEGRPLQDFGVFNILSSPKPSSYQLYLEQDALNHQYTRSKENLITWNAQGAKIRGNKLYFHSNKDWGEAHSQNVPIKGQNISRNRITREQLINEVFPSENEAKKKPLWTVGSVIKDGAIFRGRIRFENLTEEELGCLLFTMDLPADCFHKIGMGKPIGLGSIQISDLILTLINRGKRYTSLFEKNPSQLNSKSIQWNEGLMPDEKDLSKYKNKFSNYMGLCLSNSNITDCPSYWSQDRRMKELKHILTFEANTHKSNWDPRTAYPKINDPNQSNDFKQRFVLPYPSDFCNDSNYNFLQP
jgi:CRISPR-associated protein (TIGR03986 family)